MLQNLKPLSLYIHVPFCKAKCTYCDFYSIVGRESSIPAYLRSILKEIEQKTRELDLSRYYLDTIFFGGGTPNLLEPKHLGQLLETLLDLAQAGENMEIGMEINPGEASLENLKAYKALGINRVSIGMQSFQPHLLTFMSRIHSAEKSLSTYDNVRRAGFQNVSGDLIFAVPGQTRDEWVGDLERLVDMQPEHISTYSLTVEEGTALHRWVKAGHIKMLEESVDNGMYDWGRDFLEKSGYPSYEVSNHARPGFECRHNLNYWTGIDYLGFGPAAHSYFGGRRSWNIQNLDAYMSDIMSSGTGEADSEMISQSMARNEMILTRLRLTQGLNLEEFSMIYHEDLLQTKNDILKKWADKLVISDGHLKIIHGGWALTDEISSDLMSLTH
ncbi:MAG: radical SAM family heme chaperone HemW [Candidatus Marinimicrobia bacterium]|jgi:oxygen-independent coproporphyrinogen III oxidase|nr:radical SAM family heme chaperone HemW [Candidatus Neomarinimicrobiota bacterium]MBT4360285.1 radical SAM family heme chaperone HemW [Candidatus Neomarinimicrobiota bacterium]MBT4715621.1 radical SAM family heme chaperone HemW [Candidatus Neomarinimicrobiota bacterium]MBT4945480.1 radical SAM family heme chaperone HemW [Candidatus Neomarinimicrobiota bacterium]MBT5270280.1 radical SAM family heme chaperone HemW [Candidatus Neomarinimicrobiota bacterium]